MLYYIWLKAKNDYGSSGFSPVASGKPIANVAVLSLVAANEQIIVNWITIVGADQYEIFYGTGLNPPETASLTVNAPSTTATITGLVNGTSYNVWIQGKNSTGTGAISSSASAKPIGNMGDVTVSAGNQQLIVSWTAVTGADQYEIYHSTSSTMPGSPSQTVSELTATINSLNNGTSYNMWVKAKNSNGISNVSTIVNGKPLGTPRTPILTPGFRQLSVSWDSVAGADEYEVYYGIESATTLATTLTGTSAIITELINGTTYHVRLRAKNASGISGFSPTASGTPNNTLGPGFYRNGNKVGNQNLSMALSWISSNAANGDNFTIILGENVSIAPSTLGYSGKTVEITLMGSVSERTISLNSNGSMFTVNAGVTLTLEENISLVGRSANNASLVSINSGNLIMNDGAKISGNVTTNTGGGIYISNGNLTINGGIISNNIANGFYGGGGIYVASGNINMYGGTIRENLASRGGGITMMDSNISTFNMYNGEIIGNSGGGINIYNNVRLTLHGGIISNNKTQQSGGGICSWYGIITINGGVISGNTATGIGGGICSTSNINTGLTMYDGIISGNIASKGGGIYLAGGYGYLTMYDGIISGNTASAGGGVYVEGVFRKQPNGSGQNSGIIYGFEVIEDDLDGVPLKNNGGAIVTTTWKRNTTAWETDHIDTATGKGLSTSGNPPFGE